MHVLVFVVASWVRNLGRTFDMPAGRSNFWPDVRKLGWTFEISAGHSGKWNLRNSGVSGNSGNPTKKRVIWEIQGWPEILEIPEQKKAQHSRNSGVTRNSENSRNSVNSGKSGSFDKSCHIFVVIPQDMLSHIAGHSKSCFRTFGVILWDVQIHI